MNLQSDLSKPGTMTYRDATWQPSPQKGVDRLMLERIGDENANRATTIVSYQPGSSFPRHVHVGGEEFLVLEGTFSDHTGDFKRGFYVRNPIGSEHAPWSHDGTSIFVKLGQFDAKDQAFLRIDTNGEQGWIASADAVSTLPLHSFGAEMIKLLKLEPGMSLPETIYPGGIEVFVINGSVEAGTYNLKERDWLRLPADASLAIRSKAGCSMYMKTGHLPPRASF